MSDVAAVRRGRPIPMSYVGLALALASAGTWVLAGVVDDGLYVLTGVLGIAAFGSGLKGRREAGRAGAPSWPAWSGIVLGGFLGAAVVVASMIYGVSHAV